MVTMLIDQFHDFDATITPEEFYEEDRPTSFCPKCLESDFCNCCPECQMEDVATNDNPCIHCGLVFGECDCDSPDLADG